MWVAWLATTPDVTKLSSSGNGRSSSKSRKRRHKKSRRKHTLGDVEVEVER